MPAGDTFWCGVANAGISDFYEYSDYYEYKDVRGVGYGTKFHFTSKCRLHLGYHHYVVYTRPFLNSVV
jgi:hypothetical protein